MGKITRSRRARADLIEIWAYIADNHEAAADRMLARFDDALAMLADNPLAGRERPDLAPGLRSFPVGTYVLYYLPAGRGIELIRVLSGYLDIGSDDFST